MFSLNINEKKTWNYHNFPNKLLIINGKWILLILVGFPFILNVTNNNANSKGSWIYTRTVKWIQFVWIEFGQATYKLENCLKLYHAIWVFGCYIIQTEVKSNVLRFDKGCVGLKAIGETEMAGEIKVIHNCIIMIKIWTKKKKLDQINLYWGQNH